MKRTLVLLAVGSALVMGGTALRAEDNAAAAGKKARAAKSEGKPRGEHLLAPGVVAKLNLTEEQKTKIKEIETAYAKTAKEYREAHKAEFEAARTAMKEARESKDEAKRKEALEKMKQANAGLQPQRQAAIEQIKSLLTDEQKATLEAAREKRMEKGAGAVNAGKPTRKN